ncbi:MAG: DUF6063 family protein [Candidatus Muirbacterium halophilum]|nr:DUF6063 family protein [Candidatus Muirbacterium halophilum]MCK9474378.1 DUF6063 family protein [Candidatus Muirbacterium halophilum]
MSELKTALNIFRILLKKGELSKDNDLELFIEFKNPDIRTILYDFEEVFEFDIVELSHIAYIIPNSSNDLLGWTSKNMREWLGSDARLVDVFLNSYISMFILHIFYGGKNRNPKQRDFIRIHEIVEKLDERFIRILSNSEDYEKMEEKYSINFIKIAQEWDSKQGYDENSRKTKTYTVIKAARFMQKEDLIIILDDNREIRSTSKLDDIMINYYLDQDRVKDIREIFEDAI